MAFTVKIIIIGWTFLIQLLLFVLTPDKWGGGMVWSGEYQESQKPLNQPG